MSENKSADKSASNHQYDNGHSTNSDYHNKGGMIALIFSLSFVMLFFGYLVFIHPGVQLQENIIDPQATAVASDGVAQPEAQQDVTQITEPWVENAAMKSHGQKVYAQNCAMCHGPEGKGDGVAGQALQPKPRNLVEGPWKKGGGSVGLFKAITEGIPGTSMAPFQQLSVVDRWGLVQFIQSITKAKPSEDAAKVAEFGKAAK